MEHFTHKVGEINSLNFMSKIALFFPPTHLFISSLIHRILSLYPLLTLVELLKATALLLFNMRVLLIRSLISLRFLFYR